MAYHEIASHPDLQDVVRSYWLVEEWHDRRTELHSFLPERAVRLTFYSGESYVSDAARAMRPLPSAYLVGLHDSPLLAVSRGFTRALGVDLFPWGAMALFGLETVETTLRVPPKAWGLASVERELSGLLASNQVDAAVEALETWLRRRFASEAREPGKAVRAAADLYRSRGQARVAELAERHHLSPRALERGFRSDVGVSPKKLARLIRFEETYNALWLDPRRSLTDVAYAFGYSDSAHLAREFRALAHVSPSEYARFVERRRDLQEESA
ncbi:helix-turn-helix domain-containing protein [Deinococcus yavapaiensis]|uniref:AraC family transcriptional regulator n=1 Tax=Deinococcus yavapaiensis KR-236 TaxID=694435 RepID=A0A318SBC2_9DEIO|nr:helix-turn-helix domain-containing protein [Deinococcus yavapaiensis]PYE53589.1 AraC family transcriptional regulator [Deinococcus yavapaiensis KR-236]